MLPASYELVEDTFSDQRSNHKHTPRTISTERGLPENTNFSDTGCNLANSCLECPLALCKYDDPGVARLGSKALRNAEIMRQHRNGAKISKIAALSKTSERTVYRIVKHEISRQHNAGELPPKPAEGKSRRKSRKRVDPNIRSRQYPLYADVAATLA